MRANENTGADRRRSLSLCSWVSSEVSEAQFGIELLSSFAVYVFDFASLYVFGSLCGLGVVQPCSFGAESEEV